MPSIGLSSVLYNEEFKLRHKQSTYDEQYDINMIVYTCMHIVNYIMIVCNYSLVNAYMYTSRFMPYQVQDSLTLSFGRIVLVVLVLLNANIFIYDGG